MFIWHDECMDKKLLMRSSELFLKKPDILIEAMPFIRQLDKASIVIKYGGEALGSDINLAQFAKDIVLLKTIGMNPIIVHGSGPKIAQTLEQSGFECKYSEGHLVIDKDHLPVAEMALKGAVNTEIVMAINRAGGKGVGISGKDASMITAKKTRNIKRITDSNIEKIMDLGYVGEPHHVNPQLIMSLILEDYIPVIAPIGFNRQGESFLMNAEAVSGAIAIALKAERLIMLTDPQPIYDHKEKFISQLPISEIKKCIDHHHFEDSLETKLRIMVKAILNGVERGILLNALQEHALILALLTKTGFGTAIYDDKA